MYELIQVAERSYYIQSPAKIGLVRPPYGNIPVSKQEPGCFS